MEKAIYYKKKNRQKKFCLLVLYKKFNPLKGGKGNERSKRNVGRMESSNGF
jgi:hypothetical protein